MGFQEISLHYMCLLFCLMGISDTKTLNQLLNRDKSILYTEAGVDAGSAHVLTVSDQAFLTLRIRACSDAHLLLAADYTDLSFNATDIHIGANENKLIKVSGVGENPVLYKEEDALGILHCSEFRSFWISWNFGVISIGMGPTFGLQPILDVQRKGDMEHDVLFVVLTTSHGHAGTWEVDEGMVDGLTVQTPGDLRFQYIWKTVEHRAHYYSFTVAGCSDIRIALGSAIGNLEYIVILGYLNNAQSVIQKQEFTKVRVDTPGIVGCNDFRSFWVSWENGHFAAGRGFFRGQNTFMEFGDMQFLGINAVGFGSGNGAQATWVFNEVTENEFFFSSSLQPEGGEYDHWLLTSSGRFIRVFVQACADVHIALAKEFGLVSDESLYVILGGSGNSRSAIVDGSGGELTSVDTEGILHCDVPTAFWLSWRGDTLKVGRGGLEGMNVIFVLQDSRVISLKSVGFASQHDSGAFWTILGSTGDQLLLVTHNSGLYDTWTTVGEDLYLTFELNVCQQVNITLSDTVGRLPGEPYQVILVYGDNPDRAVIYKPNTGEILSEFSNPMLPPLTDCTGLQQFWMSWFNGKIEFGRGDVLQNSILRMIGMHSVPFSINAIAMTTQSVTHWVYQMDKGDMLTLGSRDGGVLGDIKFIKLGPFTKWLNFRAMGSELHLYLTTAFNSTQEGYKIHLSGSQSVIYSLVDNSALVSVETIDYIVEEEFKDFWISWNNRKLEIGQTQVKASHVFLSLELDEDENIDFESLGIDLITTTTEFRTLSRYGSELAFQTSASSSGGHQVWLETGHVQHIVFGVTACYNAEIMLSSVIFDTNIQRVYVLSIGANQNNKTRLYAHGNIQFEVDTPDLLSCDEERFFWLQFGHGEIIYGRGQIPGLHQVLSWYDINPIPVNALSFATGYEQYGVWRLALLPGALIDIPNNEDGDEGLSGGAVAGIIIGVLAGIALGGTVIYMAVFGVPATMGRCWSSFRSSVSSGPSPTRGPAKASLSFDNPVSFSDIQNSSDT